MLLGINLYGDYNDYYYMMYTDEGLNLHHNRYLLICM